LVSILVGLLLFLDEFPDVEADRMAGRRHLVILLGRRKASRLYVALLILLYFLVVLFVGLKILPLTCLLLLATGWLSYKASYITLKNYDDVGGIVPALAFNVLIILTGISLIGVGLVLGAFIKF
jgi:1,4-dihydroxy-2-naphthoate octaprenyltransferase